MVTKKSSMYSYLQGSPGKGGRYWDGTMGADDTPDREDYAHHLRSSSYHMLHSRQLSALSSGSAGSYHSRQHSNTSNYSEPDDLSPRADHASAHGHHRMDGSRYFSYDNLGPEPPSSKYHGSWNISEPDLTMGPPPYSPPGSNYQQMPAPLSPTQTSSVPPSLPSVRHSPTSSSGRHPSSPPPPPVRDASSLKYVRYGPGHEKYPSWPVAAGAVNQVLPPGTASNDANVSGLPETNTLMPNQQGSTRSKSWTEQSWTEQSGEYPKDKSVVYARPHNKKQISPFYQQQLKTVMERCEKIPKEMYECNLTDDVISPSDPYMESYFKGAPNHYPPYDREGRPLTDKDYSIPSPPERDIGMCDLNIGQLTAAQLAEYQYQYGYADLIPGTTPLLDQLRRESDIWDGRSEHDSGQGSESLADSARYSNGRESVTTVVTNSSSASSSETLKWHGSMSDISTFSGHSRDPRSDHNVVHSSRVQTPQRHNSESVLYYTTDSRGRPSRSRGEFDSRGHRERNLRSSIRDTESGLPRAINEAKYSREVERNNEMNNLKKFPSYSYTQPLSQISETPIAETHEAVKTVRSSNTRSPQSPTVDISKPPSVAERIHELERNSRSGANDSVVSLRDQSESCEREQPRSSDERSNKDVNETSEQHERNDSGIYVRDKCDISEPRGERRNSGGHKREHSRDNSETRGERRDSGGYNREHIRDTSETRSERRDSGGYIREHVRDVSETRGERRDSGGYLREHRDPSENRSERRDSRGSRELRDSSENRSERRDSRGSSMREQRDLMENRSDRRGSIREHRDSNENRDLSRTHMRRGSRESMRESRPDYLKFDLMHGENIRSPNSNGSARSPGHKESETSRPYSHENFQNMMNDYTEVDRRESNGSGVSYSYLDPEKKCKVSESTLKSIQKQAVMSFFYERNSAKSVSGASFSDLSSASSQTSLHSADSSRSGSSHTASNSGVIPVLRSDRSVRSVKGVARLGRVPEGEAGDDEANRPVRRPSVTARDLINENVIEECKSSTSQRASETPPALPQKNIQQTLECVRVSTNPSSVPHTTSSNEEVKEEQESVNQEDGSRSQSSRGHQESHAHTTALPTPTAHTVVQAHPTTAQDSHPDITQQQPPSHKDDAPPRPPERPPKKPTLRSLFHGPNPEGASAPQPASTGAGGPITSPTTSTQSPPAAGAHSPDKQSPDSDMRRIEESANELRNLSPQRPYYYRKPPAPDPPRSPDTAAAATTVATVSPPSPAQHQPLPSVNTSPSHHSNNTHDGVHLSAPNSSLAISRSSTPDLPPPPPPPVTDEEVVLCDEPLPPPPTAAEVLPGGIMLEMPPPPLPPPPEDTALLEEQHHQHQLQQQQQHHMLPPPPPRGDSSKNVVQQARQELPTYHKDSYMAHRRDWKTGFEGRYRRTISPSPPENRNLLQHRHDNSNVNNNNINNNNNNGKGGTMPSSNGGVGGLPPAGVLRAFASTSSLLHANNSKNALMDNDNCINNNGWPAHSRSSSTTVNFTAEELRAFKARRAHAQQENANALENKENAPRQMHTCQSSPALRSLASDGSTTSLATSSINSGRSASPASPSRVSPSQSWRTSLDSLHRPPSSTNSNASSTPLHQREDSGMSTSTEALSLPRSSSINESLSRISAIHDSLSRSTSVADSLGRSLSLTETSSSLSESSVPISETQLSHKSSPIQSAEPSITTTAVRHEPSSPMSPVPHDGPVTAHPATVTEEPLTPTPTPIPTPKSPLSPKTSLSPKPSLSLSPKSSISHSPKSSFSQKSPIPPTSPKSPTSPVSSSSISSPPNTTPSVEASNSFTATTIANISNISTVSSTFSSNTTSTTSAYTFPVTSPCMASMESLTSGDRSNIVVLGYGRTPYQEEIDCDQFTKDIATQLTLDNKLQALLVPGPEHKTAADYMSGVFTLELRKDLLSSQHATHPDIAATRTQQTTITTTDHANNNNNNNNTAPHTNGDVCSDASPLPSDSAYFTTSESKAKLLTRLRGSSNIMEAAQPFQDHQQLNKRKEELVKSIGRKLEILRAEQEAIKEEQKLNHELGAEVTTLVVKRASNPQSDKYKLHVEEIDKITSLLLGLSGRLARAENALRTLGSETDPEEKRILESKRDKLSEQLEEAKRLKENIDRRAVQVSKVLNQYLTEDEYADYDHFIKMKAKLIMDAREIDDKIKLGEEQQVALKEMIISFKKT